MSPYSALRGSRRMSRSKLWFAALAAAAAAGSMLMPQRALAAQRTWLGGSGTGNWNTPGLWSGGILPGQNDDTFVLNSDIFDRTVNQNAGFVTTLNLHVNNTMQIGTNTVLLPASSGLITFLEEVGTTGKGAVIN